MLTHAARAAAKQLNGGFSATSGGRARRARRALVRARSNVQIFSLIHYVRVNGVENLNLGTYEAGTTERR